MLDMTTGTDNEIEGRAEPAADNPLSRLEFVAFETDGSVKNIWDVEKFRGEDLDYLESVCEQERRGEAFAAQAARALCCGASPSLLAQIVRAQKRPLGRLEVAFWSRFARLAADGWYFSGQRQ